MTKNILTRVNEVYSEKTPSKYFDDEDLIPRFVENATNFLLKLKIPPRAFLNSTLIDFGCGTGQKTLVYDQLGASCTLIEYDKKSIEIAKKYFSKYAKNPFRFINSDLFSAKVEKASYDFVLSSGVAHHTSDPLKNLQICCDSVKNGGMLIFGITNKAGFFQRHLQRLILFSISENKEEIVKYSKILFKESLERSMRHGGRDIEAIIWDTFLNPKIYSFGTKQIIECLESNGLELYSTYRDLKIAQEILQPSNLYHKNMQDPNGNTPAFKNNNELIYLSDFEDISKSNNKTFNQKIVDDLHELLPFFNAITDGINDLSFDQHKVNFNELITNVRNYKRMIGNFQKIDILDKHHNENFFNEVYDIFHILNKDKSKSNKFLEIKKAIENSEHLFHKFNGVGMNYYCGYKKLKPLK